MESTIKEGPGVDRPDAGAGGSGGAVSPKTVVRGGYTRADPGGEGHLLAAGEAGNADTVGEDGAELGSRRVAMLLPAELLQGGETIVLLLKPSPWYILLESLRFIACVAGVVTAVLVLYRQGYTMPMGRSDVMLTGIGVGSCRLFWQFLEWLSRVYVLTDRRVIRVKGVVRVQVFETDLKNIQHTYTTFSLRERLFGLGTISFATAGTGGIEASWCMLVRPLETHQTVVRTLSRYR